MSSLLTRDVAAHIACWHQSLTAHTHQFGPVAPTLLLSLWIVLALQKHYSMLQHIWLAYSEDWVCSYLFAGQNGHAASVPTVVQCNFQINPVVSILSSWTYSNEGP